MHCPHLLSLPLPILCEAHATLSLSPSSTSHVLLHDPSLAFLSAFNTPYPTLFLLSFLSSSSAPLASLHSQFFLSSRSHSLLPPLTSVFLFLSLSLFLHFLQPSLSPTLTRFRSSYFSALSWPMHPSPSHALFLIFTLSPFIISWLPLSLSPMTSSPTLVPLFYMSFAFSSALSLFVFVLRPPVFSFPFVFCFGQVSLFSSFLVASSFGLFFSLCFSTLGPPFLTLSLTLLILASPPSSHAFFSFGCSPPLRSVPLSLLSFFSAQHPSHTVFSVSHIFCCCFFLLYSQHSTILICCTAAAPVFCITVHLYHCCSFFAFCLHSQHFHRRG